MTANLSTSGAHILVGADGSAASNAAVRYAAELASTRNRPLRIVHAISLSDMTWVYGMTLGSAPGFENGLIADGKRILASAAQLAHEVDSGLEISAEVSRQPPARILVELSHEASLVVIGESGTSRLGALGSTAVAVTSHAHAPVVVVRNARGSDLPPRTGPVVVGIDGSEVSDHAIGLAFDEASRRGAPLIALHTWSDIGFSTAEYAGDRGMLTPPIDYKVIEQAILAERLAGWQEKYPDVPVERRIHADAPRDRLLELSDEAQLIVVGSRGRGGFRGLLMGSVSNALVAHARCPVLVAKPPREA